MSQGEAEDDIQHQEKPDLINLHMDEMMASEFHRRCESAHM